VKEELLALAGALVCNVVSRAGEAKCRRNWNLLGPSLDGWIGVSCDTGGTPNCGGGKDGTVGLHLEHHRLPSCLPSSLSPPPTP